MDGSMVRADDESVNRWGAVRCNTPRHSWGGEQSKRGRYVEIAKHADERVVLQRLDACQILERPAASKHALALPQGGARGKAAGVGCARPLPMRMCDSMSGATA